MTFFRKKFSFSRSKFLMTFFSHRPYFVDFPYLFVKYDPFFTRKSPISENKSLITPFFTLFILSRASDNTTSLNIGGTDAWAAHPTSNFGGTVPPVPLGLCPCVPQINVQRLQMSCLF